MIRFDITALAIVRLPRFVKVLGIFWFSYNRMADPSYNYVLIVAKTILNH